MAHDISIPKNTALHAVQAYTVWDEQVRITAGEESAATVFLTVSGTVDILVTVLSNATLTVLCLQTEDATITQKAHLSGGATIHWKNVSLAPCTHSLMSRAEGNYAVSNIDWVFYAQGKEKQQVSADNVFEGGNGGGEITMRGVAEGNAHVTCNGMINIGLQGGGTQTYLTENVLMLDSTAKIDAIPGLEIKTNDVKASHSATVSKVTPEDLFYFASRGIDEETARKMYVQGFLGDITGKIDDTELRGRVVEAISRKMPR